MQKQSIWTQGFVGMSLSSFFQYMTHYALVAALPVFVMDSLNGNERQAGLAMTFFQIGAVLARPLAGKWIDSFDKKKMLLLSLGIFFLTSIMYLVVNNLYILLAVRLLHGAIFAIGTTTVATIATLVLPQQRKGEGIGYFAVFTNLAMVVGPFFSLIIISHYPFTILFAGCVALATLSFWCGNRNSLPQNSGEAVKLTTESSQGNRFIEPKALSMALMGGLVFFAYTGVLVFIPLYAKYINLIEYTSAFFAVFALVILATRPIVGKIFDQYGANMVIYPGFIMFLLGLISLSQIQGLLGFLISAAIIGIGFGALSPAFQTLAIRNLPEHRVGVATATYFLALDISVGLGSFLLSIVVAFGGYSYMYLFNAAIVGITAVFYYIFMSKRAAPAK
ncbi:putative MFS-type transporter YhhS [Sporomusa rhizae]|uniref:MFS transporter n=1 Tax=Sporomusa rhizae TaxID=357999 RepID=UPI00352A7ACE